MHRVTKTLAILLRPDYAVYYDHESTLRLVKRIDLTIWALENSLPDDEWDPFREALLGSRFIALDDFENEEQEKNTYYTCLREVEDTLTKYLEYIAVAL